MSATLCGDSVAWAFVMNDVGRRTEFWELPRFQNPVQLMKSSQMRYWGFVFSHHKAFTTLTLDIVYFRCNVKWRPRNSETCPLVHIYFL